MKDKRAIRSVEASGAAQPEAAATGSARSLTTSKPLKMSMLRAVAPRLCQDRLGMQPCIAVPESTQASSQRRNLHRGGKYFMP